MTEPRRNTDGENENHRIDRSRDCIMCPIRGKDIEGLEDTLKDYAAQREENLKNIYSAIDTKLPWDSFWKIFTVVITILAMIIGAIFYRQNDNFKAHERFITDTQEEKFETRMTNNMLQMESRIVDAIAELKREMRPERSHLTKKSP